MANSYTGCKKRAAYDNGWHLMSYGDLFTPSSVDVKMTFFRLDDTTEGDSIDSQTPKFCGSETDKKRFMLLCEDCARRNGLKW